MNSLFPAAAFFLAAQTLAAQSAVFRSDVKLVEVYATVFDGGGRAVSGLGREQFEIRDDGVSQPIRVFETTDKSLSCALLLDTTGSMREAMPQLRNAARSFIDALRPGDSVGVYSFTDRLIELSGMTSDRSSSYRSLARLRAGGRTALFDAVSRLALTMESLPGKKAIVVLTDGGDNASILNRQSAAARARKAGVPVFAVAEGDALHDDAAAGLLHILSETTGGHLYEAKHSSDIEKIFGAIALDLQNGYLLAFQPPLDPRPDSWHEINIQVKNTPKRLRVRARSGYSLE